MQLKDYITIGLSLLALFFSFCSIIFTYLSFRRSATRLKVQQMSFSPNPFMVSVRPNMLYIYGKQSPKLWNVVPMLYLVLYLKIDNLSHTGITISNVVLNDCFLVSKTNNEQLDKDLSLTYFSSEEAKERDISIYGHAVPMSNSKLERSHYDEIMIGDRIESKSSIEGLFIVSGNLNLYDSVFDGDNKLTIVTPDKKFDTYVEIYKTIIPDMGE